MRETWILKHTSIMPIDAIEPMNFSPNPTVRSDRDTLPPKKRDQRWCASSQLTEGATFKVPYPYKSPNTWKTGPVQPIPRRLPSLYQPWALTHTSTKAKHHILSHIQEQCSWAERQEYSPVYPRWEHPDVCTHIPGHHKEIGALGPRAWPLPRPFDLRDPGLGYGWEVPALQQRVSLNARWQANGNNGYPYIRKTGRPVDHSRERIEVGSASLPPTEDHTPQKELIYKRQAQSVYRYPERSRPGAQPSSIAPPSAGSEEECTSVAPWLLPHFMAGSLIELADGHLRRVEELQTEDFLLGSHANPSFSLSSCTVQGISPSPSSSSLSRLLILLHDQLSQELVDVYAEYPFFVRGRGWSSCCPQKTTHLCGLQCRQLNVGDVCFALTPASPQGTPHPPQSPMADLEPDRSSMADTTDTERPQALGHKVEVEPVRKRHRSAPELGVPGGYRDNDTDLVC